MRATGLFFLRMRPYTARDPASGELVLMLPVVEHEDRDGRRVTLNQMLAAWQGPLASAFWNLNLPDLKPGRALELEVDRMRWDGREWRASVTQCRLAPLPPSWVAHEQHTAAAVPPIDQPPQPLAA